MDAAALAPRDTLHNITQQKLPCPNSLTFDSIVHVLFVTTSI